MCLCVYYGTLPQNNAVPTTNTMNHACSLVSMRSRTFQVDACMSVCRCQCACAPAKGMHAFAHAFVSAHTHLPSGCMSLHVLVSMRTNTFPVNACICVCRCQRAQAAAQWMHAFARACVIAHTHLPSQCMHLRVPVSTCTRTCPVDACISLCQYQCTHAPEALVLSWPMPPLMRTANQMWSVAEAAAVAAVRSCNVRGCTCV